MSVVGETYTVPLPMDNVFKMCTQDFNVLCFAGLDKYDCEGRLITAEYPHFYFLTSCKSCYKLGQNIVNGKVYLSIS